MLFRRGAVKAPGLVISDRKDFTGSSRQQRQILAISALAWWLFRRSCAGTSLWERLGSLCPSPCATPRGTLTVPHTVPEPAPQRLCWLPHLASP